MGVKGHKRIPVEEIASKIAKIREISSKEEKEKRSREKLTEVGQAKAEPLKKYQIKQVENRNAGAPQEQNRAGKQEGGTHMTMKAAPPHTQEARGEKRSRILRGKRSGETRFQRNTNLVTFTSQKKC